MSITASHPKFVQCGPNLKMQCQRQTMQPRDLNAMALFMFHYKYNSHTNKTLVDRQKNEVPMTGAQDGSAPTFQKLLKCKILYVWGGWMWGGGS